VNASHARSIGFVSLTEHIDTTTLGGKLIFHIMGALAEFERDLIREHTLAGLSAARARGCRGGRPPVDNSNRVKLAQRLYHERDGNIADICKTLKISRTTLYRWLALAKKEVN
jgi:DNA invertase Pin-like site-specific DNA recombinase